MLAALLVVSATVYMAESSQVEQCESVATQVETFLTGPDYDILKRAVDEVASKKTTEAVGAAISAYYEAGVVKPVGYSESTRFANMYHQYIIRPCKEVSEVEKDFQDCVHQQDPDGLEAEVEMFFDNVFFICQQQVAGGERALRESYKTFEAVLAN